MKTLIPFFEGFYCSNLEAVIDDAVELLSQDDEGIEQELDVTDYGQLAIAKKWLSLYKDAIFYEYGIHLNSLKFEGLDSPKYYNYSTDKLLVSCTKKDLLQLKKLAFKDKQAFQVRINGMFKSRDGFVSFYGDFVEGWKTKPFKDWDENEISVLFPVLEIDYSELTETAYNAIVYTIKENE